MSAAKHTPGPWSVAHVYGRAYAVQCAGGAYHVGTVRGKQNASLIAAAPELLEFAEEVRRSGDTRLASMAIAIIAKATGGAA